MRIMIKGGVWKNTEDEILKAAVMKYGLNQWSRISSLLVRKSAKQCKARWYEWLDPAIKKTEWTREEDEKLLHLAKLMPCQWRTIAPIVGRTPAQCLERYEKLLDMAVSKEDQYDRRDDPRRLRPGEIDPNPESKPARPDPVDMDEDEKEMLSEARARLANTRGKKAKRKAREKQLEEARRLAQLQKKRELKAAGIEMRGKWKPKGVDYGSEVAFERKAAPGFFDTTEEDKVARELQQEFRPITVEEMEGKRRRDLEEQLVKQDIKKARTKEALDVPHAVALAQELNDPALARRRTKMMLPAPQISETELEQIARMTVEGGAVYEVEDGAGGEATRQLLGTYGPTPSRLATPARTPRTEHGTDRIMAEAQNLARMQNLATPLIGGESVDLKQLGSDFAGVTPSGRVSSTPHPLAGAATPSGALMPAPTPGGAFGATGRRHAASIAGVAATPAGLASVGGTPSRHGGHYGSATPRQTPIRDELGLNDAESMVPAGNLRAERQRVGLVRGELRAGLAGLPAPQNEYQVMAPDDAAAAAAAATGDDNEDAEEAIEEDAVDIKARRLKEEEARRLAEEKRKTQALQRHLPRPLTLETLPDTAAAQSERPEDLVLRELGLLLRYEAAKYPVKDGASHKGDKKGGKADKKAAAAAAAVVPEIQQFELSELQAAAELVEAERQALVSVVGGDLPLHEYTDVVENARRDFLWLPSQKRWGRAGGATQTDRIESLRAEFEATRAEMGREANRAARIDQKTGIVLGGLQGRDAKLRAQLDELYLSYQSSTVDLRCFEALHERELRAAPDRIEKLQALVTRATARETELQERFKALERQRADLKEALAMARAKKAALPAEAAADEAD